MLLDSRMQRLLEVTQQRFGFHSSAISTDTLLPLAGFALAFTSLHVLFAWANLKVFQVLLLPRIHRRSTRLLGFVVQLLLVTLALCLANAWWYPQSLSGDFFSVALLNRSGQLLALAIGIGLLAYFCIGIVCSLIASRNTRVAAALVVLAASTLGANRVILGSSPATAMDPVRPNVVVIGIDSLRPDHLPRFGGPFKITPHLDQLLQGSAVFTDTLTTQPHTFPATVSILTGQWPVTSGARGNLFAPTLIDTGASIAHDFRRAGYATVLGLDETRFSNIDSQYGFDTVIGPRMGLGDFVMSMIADNVLVNLTTNNEAGRLLFPLLYGNRAIDYLYDPTAFSRLVNDSIRKTGHRPLFLYLHFCVPHWPYRAQSPYHMDFYTSLRQGQYADTGSAYLRALGQTDVQVGRLLQTLKAQGVLDNAIVVTLSDHGEDFDMHKDKVLDERGAPSTTLVNGHGGSAFRQPQTRVLLAIRRFGGPALVNGDIDTPASLVDVAPTLVQMAGLSVHAGKFDGISLADAAIGKSAALDQDRIRFVESSFFPRALNKKKIDAAAVIDEASGMYEVAPNGRVQVRGDYTDFQIRYRQKAAQLGRWIVATHEDSDTTGLVIDQSRKHWWPLDQAPAEAPVAVLRHALCMHWANDPGTIEICRSQTSNPDSDTHVATQ